MSNTITLSLCHACVCVQANGECGNCQSNGLDSCKACTTLDRRYRGYQITLGGECYGTNGCTDESGACQDEYRATACDGCGDRYLDAVYHATVWLPDERTIGIAEWWPLAERREIMRVTVGYLATRTNDDQRYLTVEVNRGCGWDHEYELRGARRYARLAAIKRTWSGSKYD